MMYLGARNGYRRSIILVSAIETRMTDGIRATPGPIRTPPANDESHRYTYFLPMLLSRVWAGE
jgi:hypothetical protein